MLRLCVTGHRPDRLGGYDKEVHRRVFLAAHSALEQLKPRVVITGMALGWDQAIAEAAIELAIPFVVAMPFKGQESKWPKQSQEHYRELLKQASHIEVCSPGEYRPQKMIVRDEWMVDNSDEVLACFDGTRGGGTDSTILYAKIKGKVIYNAWDLFKGNAKHLTRMG